MLNIKLRAVEPEDLDELYAIENDQRIWSVGVTNVPYSRYLLHEYIEQSTCDIYADRQARMIIEDIELGNMIGIVDLINFDPRHLRAEIGIVIKSEYRHQGYATAAINKIAEYSQSVLHLHQLYAIVDSSNEIVAKLFKKTGFRTTSELKDWLFDGKNYRKAVVLQLFL